MNKAKRLIEIFKKKGLSYLVSKILSQIRRKQIYNIADIKRIFIKKSGLEIGGPSGIFQNYGYIPIYGIIESLDGCNYSNTTIWEGNLEQGKNYNYYNNRTGFQYISEATNLIEISDSKYDFVISSNCLEHVANPLKAIQEWIRVIKEKGYILLVLPNKDYCFDHYRPITQFEHLLNDFESNMEENDLSHLDEILELHDLSMDKQAGNLEQFSKRSLMNYENRALHHHVFDTTLLTKIFDYFKIETLFCFEGKDHVILGRKN